uniref:NADH-ubiquinone oxidoreductase chain 1 n=1 Tax=Neostromboceros nipponicus TaxID=2805799 RepID=A0A8A6C9U6_9HYME|nr:NADH dehydrogenase subunit 1 [Neostromboceros nipponicus]QTH79159.1 NADH dehydrogenase subunit 1 [Neostromboceros nipponicus]UQS76357.1 NADH dehydrogenase subunit 1 [Neostromboceros nipponicus]
MLEIYLSFLGSLILLIMVLISVAFLTLLERKLLGYIHIRKGPNKVSLIGLMQPFCDMIKLFNKEFILPSISNFYSYYLSPVFSLFLVLSSWMIMPYFTNLYSMNLSVLFFLCCISMGVYTIMIAGWSSNSKYSLLGGLRSVAQTISYEVSLVIILMSFIFMIESFSLMYFKFYQFFIWMICFTLPLSFIWFIICLAETNRTPFDFAEGESELVSGFNVEYSSGSFALIFMSEYASILLMSMLFSLMFLGGNLFSIIFYLNLSLMCFMFILIRGTLPRLRYDKLMMLTWKLFLPISLNFLMFYYNLKLMFLIFLI